MPHLTEKEIEKRIANGEPLPDSVLVEHPWIARKYNIVPVADNPSRVEKNPCRSRYRKNAGGDLVRENPHTIRDMKNFTSKRLESPSHFDKRSFRTIVQDNGTEVIIGCPKGHYDAKTGRCRVGTRAQAIRTPKSEKRRKRNPDKLSWLNESSDFDTEKRVRKHKKFSPNVLGIFPDNGDPIDLKLTTEHSASSYEIPVLMDQKGLAYGIGEMTIAPYHTNYKDYERAFYAGYKPADHQWKAGSESYYPSAKNKKGNPETFNEKLLRKLKAYGYSQISIRDGNVYAQTPSGWRGFVSIPKSLHGKVSDDTRIADVLETFERGEDSVQKTQQRNPRYGNISALKRGMAKHLDETFGEFKKRMIKKHGRVPDKRLRQWFNLRNAGAKALGLE